MTEVRVLTGEQTRGLVSPAEAVDAVRAAYRERGRGAPAEPRTTLAAEDPPGMLTDYVAVLPETGAMGGYVYAAGFGDRDAWFATPLFDAETGALKAIVDGAPMNPLKTGAVGAVGVDALAREDAAVLGVVGSGRQARAQVRAAATVREFDSVWVYSPTAAHREAFAAALTDELDAAVAAVASSAAAVEDADVVVTATNAAEPVFDGDRLADGAHVTAMGQYHPQKRELDDGTVARSVYVPDLRERAFQDAGSFLHALDSGAVTEDHVHGELGDVLVGRVPGRESPDDVTVFDSGGTAIETVAVANLVYERAVAADRGTTLEFTPMSET